MSKLMTVVLSILLPSCSLVFAAAPDGELSTGADSGMIASHDSGLSFMDDSGTQTPDGSATNQTKDAGPPPCDPFTEQGCYVDNNPRSGPDFYEPGTIAECTAGCVQSSDCSPGLFCTGVGGGNGTCVALCDSFHLCADGSCARINYQDFGVCPFDCV